MASGALAPFILLLIRSFIHSDADGVPGTRDQQ